MLTPFRSGPKCLEGPGHLFSVRLHGGSSVSSPRVRLRHRSLPKGLLHRGPNPNFDRVVSYKTLRGSRTTDPVKGSRSRRQHTRLPYNRGRTRGRWIVETGVRGRRRSFDILDEPLGTESRLLRGTCPTPRDVQAPRVPRREDPVGRLRPVRGGRR